MSRSIVFLCKRRPQNKDIYGAPYGRFFNLAKYAAKEGFDAHLILADYSGGATVQKKVEGVQIYSVDALKFWRYCALVKNVSASVQPKLFVGFSDTYYGILARFFSKSFRCKYLIDAYDNYESYMSWARPLHWLWRSSLKSADGLTAAGPQLLEKLSYANDGCVKAVVPMAPDKGFVSQGKPESRHKLGLPINKKLIGYVGSLARNRGVDILFDGYDKLKEVIPEVRLVLSGRVLDGIKVPVDIIHLGYIEDGDVPFLLSALDVSIVIGETNSFGNYSYPIKLYESLSCDTPVVAANTPPNAWILKEFPNSLFQVGDVDDFVRKVSLILSEHSEINSSEFTWEKSSEKFIECINKLSE